MDKNIFVLLIQDDAAGAEWVRQALHPHEDGAFRLQRVERLPTAVARIAGGDVDVVLLDLALSDVAGGDRLDGFLRVRREAPRARIVVLCGAGDEGLALRAMRGGAADYVIKEQGDGGLGRAIRSAMAAAPGPIEPMVTKETRKTGAILALLGAKGGVGTTTVALNVASALAQRNQVILVEMQPAFGSLSQYFQPERLTRNLSHLLQAEPAVLGAAQAETCLWRYQRIPGLRVLFAPQTAAECGEIGPDHAKAIPRALAELADFVVADLPASLSDANRAVVENCGILAQVVERDPVCVQSAKRMARAMESWRVATKPSGTVVVNRTSLTFPMSLPEIDAQLGCLALGVIPPEPDLCLCAQNARMPLVTFLPDSPLAGSLTALAERLAVARQ